MKHASALVAVLARNLTSAASKGQLLPVADTSLDSSAAAQSESADEDGGNLHAKHARYSFIMVLILMTLFIFVTLSLTGAMLAFCRKTNTVFTHYDGVATTSGEFVGGGGGRISIEASSELELGALDADGERTCGASDRGQIYHQLSDHDGLYTSDGDTDDSDDSGPRAEHKKMLKYNKESKLNSHREMESKTEAVLRLDDKTDHLNSEYRVAPFQTAGAFLKQKYQTKFKFFRQKNHKLVSRDVTHTNGSSGSNKNKPSATHTKCSSGSSNNKPSAKSRTVHRTESESELDISVDSTADAGPAGNRNNLNFLLEEKGTLQTRNTNLSSLHSAYPSTYQASRSKRHLQHGTGNVNFRTGRRNRNATCVNQQHNHASRKPETQSGETRASTQARCSRRVHNGQRHSYQARMYRRLQEQASRLNRDGVMTSSESSGHSTCAHGVQCGAQHQRRKMRRCQSGKTLPR